jgi:two-component system OmpR family sensor kinase
MVRQTGTPSGLVVAAVGFFLTRITVTVTVVNDAAQFYFAGVVPLGLGLGLAAFGVILTVGPYERTFVRTTALWCVLGTAGMGVLVLFTLLGSQTVSIDSLRTVRSQAFLSNFPIGGAVGGTLTGVYAAHNRRQREQLTNRTNRLVLLNRMLRDKVINAAAAIRGHNEMLKQNYNEDSLEVIGRQADTVVENIENVKYLVGAVDSSAAPTVPVDVDRAIEESLAEVNSQFPDAEYEFLGCDEPVYARANEQLGDALTHLVQNAAQYGDPESPRVTIETEQERGTVIVRVSDNGPGLPEAQQTLLEDGEIAEFDDPRAGFGLKIVRLLVTQFDGDIRAAVSEAGTVVELRLPRTTSETGESVESAPAGMLFERGVASSRIALAIGSALVAGMVMGMVMLALGDPVPVIGVLYGVENQVVGWLSHEFHSVVFGLVYAAITTARLGPDGSEIGRRLAIAVGLGFVLWLLAAGLVMPVWLVLIGLPTAIPNVTVPSLIGHLSWALTLGLLYSAGDRWLAGRDVPLLAR